MANPLNPLALIFKYINDHQKEFIDNLRDAVAIKSVSADPECRPEIRKMVEWVAQKLTKAGAKVTLKELDPIDGLPLPPVLLAQLGDDPKKKTVCIYGHLDVQPAKKEDGWATDPFELVEKDGKLFGRGSTDNKGPVLGWIHAIEAFQSCKIDIPVNIKFCFEGMEESGSEGLDELLISEKDKFLKGVDYVCISDNYWLGTKTPCLCYGLRGICYFFIEVTCAEKDLHSGVFGGSVDHGPWTINNMVDFPRFCVGIGYDVHKFVMASDIEDCYIKICGVFVKHNMKIEAHSDGDVGIHAIVDAIFGAVGLGDIGEHFPPTDMKWKDKDSSHFLNFAVEEAKKKGYLVSNADITIICERPKISSYKNDMKKRMSELLQCDFVNIKATTTEKLGALGRKEGIAAQAVVCMRYSSKIFAWHEAMTDLNHLLNSLVSNKGEIQIEGIMEDVEELKSDEKLIYEKIDFDVNEYRRSIGSKGLIHVDSKEKTLMHRWRFPSLSIHGIQGAFDEDGAKTVIPSKVTGKFSIRIVPNQTPEKVSKLVVDHLEKKFAQLNSPNKMAAYLFHGGEPWMSEPNHPHYQAGCRATKSVYGIDPDLIREGGSIPVTLTLQQVTGKNVMLLPMGAADDGAHSQNEKIDVRNYIEGTKVLAAYLHEVSLL